MPSLPELGYIFCQIGCFEVVHQVYTHYFCTSDSNNGVSVKVAVNLERVENDTFQYIQRRIVVWGSIYFVNNSGQIICNHHFDK